MLQMSKLIRSREEWRKKAVQRAEQVRELKKAKRRYQNRIAELKTQLTELASKKNQPMVIERTDLSTQSPVTDLSQVEQVRVLCILLVIQGVASYRSIPRILKLFNAARGLTTAWVPHFTSVINWILRLGLGLLRQVKPMTQPWLAIIDHSIDVGTKKAMVVLRIPMRVLSRKDGAVQLQDCECIGLHISDTVNGDSIASELTDIFQQSGIPSAIIKDCDRTLNKGVNLWREKQETDVLVIEDISHVMAAALKKQFESTDQYQKFTTLISQGATNLRQTTLSFLAPPKLRTKGRFLNIGRLGLWGAKMLEVLSGEKEAHNENTRNKLRAALPGFDEIRPFIRCFAQTADVVSQVMETLKNNGLNQAVFRQCRRLTETLPKDSSVRQRLLQWLERHIAVRKQITHFSLPVCSDIIESLFGRFKYMLERNPQADMNRSVLLIPALCGNLNDAVIKQVLDNTPHDKLKKWEPENIPYTIRKKRQEFFNDENPKTGKEAA